jgi:hypothetical protein
VVETDASNLGVMGSLSQYDDEGILHLVANFSGKHSPMENNYEIYNKELLTIIRTFKEWYTLLNGTLHTLDIISDYLNQTDFTTI